MTFPADVKYLDRVLEHINGSLEKAGCPMKTQVRIDTAAEEIFVNIAGYAYGEGQGDVTVDVTAGADGVTIAFIDSGTPYDPLSRPDPDISLPAAERPIGGLGIYMAKKLTDELIYEYRDGRNILTMKKFF